MLKILLLQASCIKKCTRMCHFRRKLKTFQGGCLTPPHTLSPLVRQHEHKTTPTPTSAAPRGKKKSWLRLCRVPSNPSTKYRDIASRGIDKHTTHGQRTDGRTTREHCRRMRHNKIQQVFSSVFQLILGTTNFEACGRICLQGSRPSREQRP